MTNMRELLTTLNSDKIKQRTEALENLRRYLSSDVAVANFVQKTDNPVDKLWLPLFQALFNAGLIEKATIKQKPNSSATALKRLTDVAATIRWLLDRSRGYTNSSVFHAVYEHCMDMLKSSGSLFIPSALPYAKILHDLFSIQPNLDHIKDDMVIRTLEMCFNVIFDDPFTTRITDDNWESNAPSDNEGYETGDTVHTGMKRGRSVLSRSHSETITPQTTSERVEFNSILSLLLKSSPAILLHGIPGVTEDEDETAYPKITRLVLRRLQRFLETFGSSESSLYRDFLPALSGVIALLGVNRREDMIRFARDVWPRIVGLWATKEKSLKEQILIILHQLMPYYTAEQRPLHDDGISRPFNISDGLIALYEQLEEEILLRRSLCSLELSSLILEAREISHVDKNNPFSSRTFRASLEFSVADEISWVMLELAADCVGTEIVFSESSDAYLSKAITTPKPSRKRNKGSLATPLSSLLARLERSFDANDTSNPLNLLPCLLFILERHWSVIPSARRSAIYQTLTRFLSVTDAIPVSWALTCFASLAYSEALAPPKPGDDSQYVLSPVDQDITWDQVWTHAIRRVQVPNTCRAACHLANVLLTYWRRPKDTHHRAPLIMSRVIEDIGPLGRDLDLHGPNYPYDSVCLFLSTVLSVSAEDNQLHRQHLNTKILAWLIPCVSQIRGTSKGIVQSGCMPQMLSLLKAICGSASVTSLLTVSPVATSDISAHLRSTIDEEVIRTLLLQAKLPVYIPDSDLGPNSAQSSAVSEGLARRISLFLDNLLQQCTRETEQSAEKGRFRVDDLISYLHTALLSLAFETELCLSGLAANSSSMALARGLLHRVVEALKSSQWTVQELLSVLIPLEPFIISEQLSTHDSWEPLLQPERETGIKGTAMIDKESLQKNRQETLRASRIRFQRIFWKEHDINDSFRMLLDTFRGMLRGFMKSTEAFRLNQRDDFEETGTIKWNQYSNGLPSAVARLTRIYTSFLITGTLLQSDIAEPMVDKDLMKLITESLERSSSFVLGMSALHALVEVLHFHNLCISTGDLKSLLKVLGTLAKGYEYGYNEAFIILLIRTLRATHRLWSNEPITRSFAGPLGNWLFGAMQKRQRIVRPWRVRDEAISFFRTCFRADPTGEILISDDKEEDAPLSRVSHAGFNSDPDIRVRFRVAIAVSELFLPSFNDPVSPFAWYEHVRTELSSDLSHFEGILTRFLTLGNVIIASSAIRRGPYWHLLETCLPVENGRYADIAHSILLGVSSRLQISLSSLFNAYGTQLAFSLLDSGYDFFRLPLKLVGFRDSKEFAEAAFHAFTPLNILAGQDDSALSSQCRRLNMSMREGIDTCFGEVVGFGILHCIDQGDTRHLEAYLLEKTRLSSSMELQTMLLPHLDRISTSVLQTLSEDTDSLLRAVEDYDPQASTALQQLMREHSKGTPILVHNKPSFGIVVVLKALTWIREKTKKSSVNEVAVSYHVLHQLFAKLHETPLIEEELRLMHAICFWTALRHADFHTHDMLYTLLRGGCNAMAQPELMGAAQSVMDWALDRYLVLGSPDPRITDILIRTSYIANQLAHHTFEQWANVGSLILHWLDRKVLKLLEEPWARDQVLVVLTAWSHSILPKLSDALSEVTSSKLSAILSDYRVTTNRFRVVRRLCEQSYHNPDTFGETDFWRLWESIPKSGNVLAEDADDFCQLLVENKGTVIAFGKSQLYHPQSDSATEKATSQEAVVHYLVELLQHHDPTEVSLAYWTLKRLASTDFPVPKEYQAELSHIRAYPTLLASQGDQIIESLQDERFLKASEDFPTWIRLITSFLVDILSREDSFYGQLSSFVSTTTAGAESLLPLLVERTLVPKGRKSGAIHLAHRHALSLYFNSVLCYKDVDPACIRGIIQLAIYMRNFPVYREYIDPTTDPLTHDKWLILDFARLAHHAVSFGSFTTAVLFLELANEHTGPPGNIEALLYEIYGNIDEPDGFYGIKDADHRRLLVKRFHHEGEWDKALQFHGAAWEAKVADAKEFEGLLSTLKSLGLNHLVSTVLQNAESQQDSSLSVAYPVAWQTETWDLPDSFTDSPGLSLYRALKAHHIERDPDSALVILRSAVQREIGRLRLPTAESITSIRSAVQNLMCLYQLTQWNRPAVQSLIKARNPMDPQWDPISNISDDFSFRDCESIMLTRVSLLHALQANEVRIGENIPPFLRSLLDIEKKCFLRISQAARRDANHRKALLAIANAQRLDTQGSAEVDMEFARVLWLTGEQKEAVELLRSIRQNLSSASLEQALIDAQLGEWSAKAYLEEPAAILRNYFNAATETLAQIQGAVTEEHASVYHKAAVFAEQQYRFMVTRSDAKRAGVFVARSMAVVENLTRRLQRALGDARQDVEKNLSKNRKIMSADQAEYEAASLEQANLLCLAIDNFSKCLSSSDHFDDDSTIRLCSLWLANFDLEKGREEDQVAKTMHKQFGETAAHAINQVASRKFVFLAHQLTARLHGHLDGSEGNQKTLQTLILRMCAEHPFHAIYHIYSQRIPDSMGFQGGVDRTRRSSTGVHSNPRSVAAGEIWDKLKMMDQLRKRVDNIQNVCSKCLAWAKFQAKSDLPRGDHVLPRNHPLLTIVNPGIPVMTCHTPLDITMKYDKCVLISRYSPRWKLLSGQNAPKRVTCIGTDAVQYLQLFKGEGADDLRQDAVMEQVFGLVNQFLVRDKETKRRSLRVRDYKVIPLDGVGGGIIEFVDQTITLCAWLLHAHKRYQNPGQLRASEMQTLVKNLQEHKIIDTEEGVKRWTTAFENFKPVMRHYFHEKHKDAMLWFTMRLNYTRSTATNSIVGHILGLGDRHTSNILIDERLGELIHIDLGISFDQGKLLTVPETVPFRMTRDMVDGMGMSGTNGVFQRCAEEVLRVLRSESTLILTILDVFRHDPLYHWVLTQTKLTKLGVQGNLPVTFSEDAAERALLGVQRKLDTTLSVSATVNGLIAEATDTTNLRRIFHGWAGWM